MIEEIQKNVELLQAGEVNQALQNLQDLLRHPNMTDDLRYEIAQFLHQHGFVKEAIPIATELINMHPEEYELLLFLAELYMEEGMEEEALAILDRVKGDAEEQLRSILLTADIYIEQGLYEVAEYKLKQALDRFPDQPILYTALGEIYYLQEKYQLAILSYQRGNDPLSSAKLADCYAHLGEFEQALPHYEQATREHPSAELLFGYGFVAFQLKDWELAISNLTALLDTDPHFTSAYPLVAEAYQEAGEDESALEWIEKGIQYDQTNPYLFALKGIIVRDRGESNRAREAFQQALQIDDAHIPALEHLIEMAETEEDWLQCLEYMDRLLELLPERGDIYRRKGMVYEELEEWEKAAQNYRHALQIDDQDVKTLNQLALLMRDEGQLAEALSFWKKSVSIDDTQWEIEEWIQRYEQE